MTGRSLIGPALTTPTKKEEQEIFLYHRLLARRLSAFTRDFEAGKEVYKAIAHALLYRCQHHGIPTTELLAFLRAMIPQYIPKGSQLNMAKELKHRLENSAGMPEWPGAEVRKRINGALAIIYRETDAAPVSVQVRIFWHLLMVNAEGLGMTHEAVLRRLEVLDRMQRAEGSASRMYPDTPPSWHKLAQQQKRG